MKKLIQRLLIARILIGLAAVSMIILLLPLMAALAARLLPPDWQKMNSSGPGYTGVSVLLTALAVLVAVCSVRISTRQVKEVEQMNARSMQFQLQVLGLQNPDLLEVLADQNAFPCGRRGVYLNMCMHYYRHVYENGILTSTAIERNVKREIFANPVGIEWWKLARASYSQDSPEFFELIDSVLCALEAEENQTMPTT